MIVYSIDMGIVRPVKIAFELEIVRRVGKN
jgi:hypothetical protein